MKILRVIPSINPDRGGPIEGLKRASLFLSKKGVETEIATLDARDAYRAETEALPWPVHKLGQNKLGMYGYAPEFSKWVDANVTHYDTVIIHGNWQFHGFATSRACRKHKVPYFIYPHGMLDPWFNEAYPLKKLKKLIYWRWGEHPVLRHAQAVLFTCEDERLLARESFRPYKVKEQVIGYGTSKPEFDIDNAVCEFRSAPPDWAQNPYLLFLGRIQEKKGIDLLVDAYVNLRSEYNEIPDLVIAGPEEQPELAHRIRSQYSMDGIHWIGSISGIEKWQALGAAEALVLPSHQENFGIVVAEALLTGTPALISNKVNIWRNIDQSKAGFVSDDTVEGAHEIISNWLKLSTEEKDLMRESARELYETTFDLDRSSERLIDFIKSEINLP